MELVVTITTLIVVVILQIIILANQQKNSKLIKEFVANRAKHHPDRDRSNDRRDNNFRQQRNNQQNNNQRGAAPQSSTSPAAVDNVEKSLRDINLKLKNAERDQEVARKRLNEGGTVRDPQDRPDRDRPPRNNRDRDGNRGRDGHRRDRNGNSRGGNWRNNRGEGESRQGDGNSQLEHPAVENDADAVNETSSVVASSTSLPNLNPVDFDADLEHGRKFTVKRRALSDESAEVGVAPSESSGTSEPSTFTSAPESQDSSSSTDSEISFGRR